MKMKINPFNILGILVAWCLVCCQWIHASAPLKAYYMEVESGPLPGFTGLAKLLTEAGFSTEPLPLDRNPGELGADLIVLGSFANTDPVRAEYVKKQAGNLRKYVENGGVLLQMAQKEESQISPLFLPEGMRAGRGDAVLGDIRITQPDHVLLKGLGGANGQVKLVEQAGLAPSWHTFMEQRGFGVLMGAAGGVDNPVLLEGEAGKGRLLLTSLFFDRLSTADEKEKAPEGHAKFAEKFMQNLRGYVEAVRAGRAEAVVVTPQPEPKAFVPGSWTIAVLPDTQYYAQKYPEVFERQTEWIAEKAKDLNIKYVLHLGDITNKNEVSQWQAAAKAMSKLDGLVPYAMVGGNHDYGPGGNSASRETFFSAYFPVKKFEKWPTFGGVMEPGKIDNSYHVFEAGGQKWIVLALEWGPRDKVVAWANEVLSKHPDHKGILITHAYMAADNRRFDRAKYGKQSTSPHNYKLAEPPGEVNDGGELWEKLVSRHPNMVMTINGHVLNDGVARLSSKGAEGKVVHQMLVNYQRMQPQNGNGFLRLYEFLPDGETIQVRSYSPLWDVYKTDVQNQFTLKIHEAEEGAQGGCSKTTGPGY